MATDTNAYPATVTIDYPKKHDKVTTFFRIFYAIPALIVISLISGSESETFMSESGKEITTSSGGIIAGLFAATALMILFRQRYPRWWFDFSLELNRFSTRVTAYLFLMTDAYPSTVEQQSVHLHLEYPDVKKDLNRWLPLVKWLLAFPHYIVLVFLVFGAFIATIIAWVSILFTGSYPKDLFDFVEGVIRWGLRVNAYAFLLTTDKYPPFSLK
jgi:Domain of unknown function (DUF4389)